MSAGGGAGPAARPAAILKGMSFGPERLILDGLSFQDCTFTNTTLIYYGGKAPELQRCKLDNVRFEFEGPAGNTVELLRWLLRQGAIDRI